MGSIQNWLGVFYFASSRYYPMPKTCSLLSPSKAAVSSSLHFYCCFSAASKSAYCSGVAYLKSSDFCRPKVLKRQTGEARTYDLGYLGRAKWKDRSRNYEAVVPAGEDGLKWCSLMLRNCAINLWLGEGKAIHGNIIKNGIELDSHLWVSLINFYAKCGALDSCSYVFEQMPIKDVVSWTALISGFVAEGHGNESLELFCKMRRDNVRPNEFTLATVLKACSMCLDLEFGKQLHVLVVKIGPFSDIYVGSALVDLYAKCGEMDYASDVFHMMPEQNAVSWNALLNGFVQVGDGDSVLRLFCRMSESTVKHSNYTLSTVLKGCANSGNLKAGRVIHSIVIKIGVTHDDFINSCLVDMYSKCGHGDDALEVFNQIKDPDIVAWTAIISTLNQQGQKEKVAKLFSVLMDSGVRPNQFTLSSLVSAATDLGDFCYCKSIHGCIYKLGFQSEDVVSNSLIAMYMKFGAIYDGTCVFNTMIHKDVVSWNNLLAGFHDDETSEEGPRMFKQMLEEELRPNIYTFLSILRSCSSLSNVKLGEQVHAHIIKDKLESNNFVGTALMDMYAKSGSLEDVEVIFSRLNEKDIFTWTVIISSCSQNNEGEKAVQHFNQMRREGVKPNEFTLASCLRGCATITSIENGRQLHSLAIKGGQSADIFVASALVDMYGKCGCIEDAEALFNCMNSDDTVLWNTIICGYAQHGQGEKALHAFRTMINKKVLPDKVSFVAVLSACSHMGLVDEGKRYFSSMSEYGISPSIEHDACMVNILGRAGKFDDIETFIKHRKITPNALIWENVLGACKVHGNLELGEKVAEELFKLEPEIDSNYVLLSNLYAAKGSWSKVAKVRASMSDKGIKKEPGCSWVVVDAEVHVFLSQDASHPRLRDIHQKLDELQAKLSASGYEPNTNYVLQNVTEREKRSNLSHHSERLALGCALISKTPSDKIRIFKNLRICGDCHEFMKHVSSTVNKEIVIRDTSHFHHFQNGTCSCKDYW